MKYIITERQYRTLIKENDELEKMSKRVGHIIDANKPDGVSDIEYELSYVYKYGGNIPHIFNTHISNTPHDKEYSLNLTFVVPPDSKYLKVSGDPYEPQNHMRMTRWAKEIRQAINDYLGIKVVSGDYTIRSSEFNL